MSLEVDMVKLALILVLPVSTLLFAGQGRHECSEHSFYLDIQAVGHEHANHLVSLNGQVRLTELAEGNWFIERVECTNQGFSIEASHRQYGDPAKSTFSIQAFEGPAYKIYSGAPQSGAP